jgi:protein-S-isoprenylcysteine O-methyltransferase Ste14
VILIIIGIVLNIWTDLLFTNLNTTVKPHEDPTTLITSGSFSISRHPMYLGMAGALLGLSVLLGSLITFVSPILFVSLMELRFIPLEEKNMERIFGVDYLEYERKVRR